jgi:hypothetical protein
MLAAQLLGLSSGYGAVRSTVAELMCTENRGVRRHEENGAGGEAPGEKLAVDKGGRGWSAAHVEAVLHGRRVEVAGGGAAAWPRVASAVMRQSARSVSRLVPLTCGPSVCLN